MKKLKAFILALIVSTCGLHAQSTNNISGGSGKINSATYSYSVGEMVLVSTFESPKITVTQGLLQPANHSPTNLQDYILTKDELQVYPNPSQGAVNIKPNFTTGGELQIVLLDLSGKIIMKKNVSLEQGNEVQQIDLSWLANGNYMLQASYNTAEGNKSNNFKIQKLKL